MNKITEGEMMRTYQRTINRLYTKVISSKKHVLDNEDSAKYKEVIKKSGMEYELVPPHMHIQNFAGRAIQTFKEKFVGILSNLTSPLHWLLWDKFLPQVEMNINMIGQ